MTWFSDRSGIASTGMVSRARTPATPRRSEARITRNRLRIDHSMIGSITVLPPSGSMPVGAFGWNVAGWGRGIGNRGRAAGVSRSGAGIDPALGVDQERAVGCDLLAGRQALQHREAVADARAEDDPAAIEDSRLALDVDD